MADHSDEVTQIFLTFRYFFDAMPENLTWRELKKAVYQQATKPHKK
jgi:hypothetical protein